MYVSKSCNCGPHLDSRKILQLPNNFGPAPISKVLREAVQSCVDCARDERAERSVFNTIKDGDSKVVITGGLLE